MNHTHKSNFTGTIDGSCSNLNDFSDTTSYTINHLSSYASLTVRKRRNQRRLRRRGMLNHIRRLLPIQNTNNSFTNQFFNGITFP
ncbi:hypothetical protein RclHR1_00770009 [Rhizophagus clarus]|uniref:Uncharacterized protein n=1 Tax=Rhizophagus clarus TaxID=94130 RepID=A0A2Z6RXS0_9GLOM|nr:hypothetical protein RclHR1_00770009 [Rhizophagus clarus]GES85596.1 hypothetical protein GLOIN_2v1773984 [Rhizophagus clarus]